MKQPLKIVLVRPAMKHADLVFPDGPRLSIPLGLLYLGGVFKNSPVADVTIIDAFAHPDLEKIERSQPPFLFGLDTEELLARIETIQPDMVGISSSAIPFFEKSTALANAIKERWPSIFTFVGGGDATARSDQYFTAAPLIDAVMHGEGEETIFELASAIYNDQPWQEIRNLERMEHGAIVLNEKRPYCSDPDQFYPDFSLIDMEHYFTLGKVGFLSRVSFQYPESHRAVHLVTSRGCPFRCSFCSIHLHMGRSYRSHSASYTLSLLEELKERYAIRHVYFEDDHLLMQKEELKLLLNGMIERKLNITWSTPNGVRADGITNELAALMKASGCLYLVLGVESASPTTLDKVHKNLDLEKVVASVKACRDNKLDAFGFYIFGFPHETISDMEKTLHFAIDLYRKYRFVPFIHLFKPLWGTELYNDIVQHQRHYLIDTTKVFGPRDYKIPHFLFGPKMIETENFNLKDLSRLYRKYISIIAQRSFLYWCIETVKKPHVMIHHLFYFIRDCLVHFRSIDKIVLIYFWHIWIYPQATLSEYRFGVVNHLADFLSPSKKMVRS